MNAPVRCCSSAASDLKLRGLVLFARHSVLPRGLKATCSVCARANHVLADCASKIKFRCRRSAPSVRSRRDFRRHSVSGGGQWSSHRTLCRARLKGGMRHHRHQAGNVLLPVAPSVSADAGRQVAPTMLALSIVALTGFRVNRPLSPTSGARPMPEHVVFLLLESLGQDSSPQSICLLVIAWLRCGCRGRWPCCFCAVLVFPAACFVAVGTAVAVTRDVKLPPQLPLPWCRCCFRSCCGHAPWPFLWRAAYAFGLLIDECCRFKSNRSCQDCIPVFFFVWHHLLACRRLPDITICVSEIVTRSSTVMRQWVAWIGDGENSITQKLDVFRLLPMLCMLCPWGHLRMEP